MKKKQSRNTVAQSNSSNTMVLISKEIKFTNRDSDSHHLEIIDLRHPRYDGVAKFVYNSEDNSLCELLKFAQPYRSWFIGNSISSDGSMYLSTNIDPLFLVLPYFQKTKMSSTFEQVIHDDDFMDSMKLEALVNEEQLSLIAKKKDCSGLIVWKYDEERTLSWLKHKVKQIAIMLQEKNINVNTSCAVSSTFIKSVKDSPENYLHYAYGMVSDYLTPVLIEKLSYFLQIPPVETNNPKKRKTTSLDADEIKRIKMECREKELAEIERKKEKPVVKRSTKQIALAKAAAGSKSISVFFKKKE